MVEDTPTNPSITSLSDANGNTYNIADILTIKGSLGGGPWNIADINTFACGDAVYSIER